MTRYVAAYAGTVMVMVLLDLLWLGVIAKSMYEHDLGHLMANKPNVPVAIVFYALYAMGIVIFAVSPQTNGVSWNMTLTMGALFGLFAYATYDLTNLATLRDWPLGLSLIDIAWGVVVTALSAAGGKAALEWATRS